MATTTARDRASTKGVLGEIGKSTAGATSDQATAPLFQVPTYSPSNLTSGNIDLEASRKPYASLSQPATGEGATGASSGSAMATDILAQAGIGEPAAKKADEPLSQGAQNIQSAIGSVAQIYTQMDATAKELAARKYATDLAKWEAEGKTWFDPRKDVAPTFDEYKAGKPSKVGQLEEGKNALHQNEVVSYILDPGSNWMGSVSEWVGEEEKAARWRYAASTNTEGAAIGYDLGSTFGTVGGVVGAILGGVVGTVYGWFTMGSAQEEDKKDTAKLLGEYNKKYQEWLKNREIVMNQLKAKKEADEKTERLALKAKKLGAEISKRQLMLTIIDELGNKPVQSGAFSVPIGGKK